MPLHTLVSDSMREKKPSLEDLVQQIFKMVQNRGKSELLVLKSMKECSFSLPRLKESLRENNFDISISRAKYVDFAPMVGLDPALRGSDMPFFKMFRARLPNAIFHRIVEDFQILSAQYGTLDEHENEEARSRYLAAYFNQIVALFSGIFSNTPETILESKCTSKDRIEYLFKINSAINVIFIEVKPNAGNRSERLDFFAQVIAECYAADLLNRQNGIKIPIYAVLCDGRQFYFFKFENEQRGNDQSAHFCYGRFCDGDRAARIGDYGLQPGEDPLAFTRQVRRACDSLYYMFLMSYISGLEAYWNHNKKKGKFQGEGRAAAARWTKAMAMARNALAEGISARSKFHDGDLGETKMRAEGAYQYLTESTKHAPFKKSIVLSNYKEEMADL